MNNVGNFLNMLQQLKQNPMSLLGKRFNIPQDIASNPEAIIQHLLNTNQISQQQLNNAFQAKENPMFKNLFR